MPRLKQGESLTPFEYGPGDLRADDVEAEVLYCGVCHSDMRVIGCGKPVLKL